MGEVIVQHTPFHSGAHLVLEIRLLKMLTTRNTAAGIIPGSENDFRQSSAAFNLQLGARTLLSAEEMRLSGAFLMRLNVHGDTRCSPKRKNDVQLHTFG